MRPADAGDWAAGLGVARDSGEALGHFLARSSPGILDDIILLVSPLKSPFPVSPKLDLVTPASQRAATLQNPPYRLIDQPTHLNLGALGISCPRP